MTVTAARALGPEVWGRRVARLPSQGVLLVATDLQGNWGDYQLMLELQAQERARGHDAILAFCGDMVHGPSPDLLLPGAWPRYLGSPYMDRSSELIRHFEEYTRAHRAFSILGNHEHAHIGGPVVPKFYDDEAAVLDAALGDARPHIHAFLRDWPLVAVAPCGVVLTHGAPRATEKSLEDFESLRYDGYRRVSLDRMYAHDTVGALLWARAASGAQARALLRATALGDAPNTVCVYGHDVVQEGYTTVGDEQLCLSTSFGLENSRKLYLRIDLSKRYRSVRDLRPGVELLPLYP